MWTVLPDANALYGVCVGAAPSVAWSELLERARLGHIRLAIAECTIIELEALLEREAVSRTARFLSAQADLRALGLDAAAPALTPPKELASARVHRLRRELRDNGATVLGVPPVGHAELTRRAAERRPPFDAKGGGYRDALLWSSALDLASDAWVMLVTNDKAFSGDDKHTILHPALRGEAQRKNIRLARSVGEVLETLGAEWSTLAGALDRRLRIDHDFAWDLFKAALEPLICHRMLPADLALGRWPRSIAGIQVNSVELPNETRVLAARKNVHGGTEATISMRLEAELDLRAEDLDDEILALVPWEQVRDVGRGLVDPHTQICGSLEVVVTASVVLDRQGHIAGPATIVSVALPRGEQVDGQLELPTPPR